MNIYATSRYFAQFAASLAGTRRDIRVGSATVSRFPNNELHAIVHENVVGEPCIIIGSVAPPDDQLLTLVTLASALKRSGARSLGAFLPYLGYARQDKFAPGESSGIMLVGALLKAAGVDTIVTVDVHSELDHELIGLPLVSVSPAAIFAQVILQTGWKDPTIIAPDEGAINRATAVARAVKSSRPVAHLVKRRVDKIVHRELIGDIGTQAIIVDDIIDSGQTLLSASMVIREHGAEEILVAVTHGLFTGDVWRRAFDRGVGRLFVSNSCPEATRLQHPAVTVVPLQPLLPTVRSNLQRKETHHGSITT